MLRCYAGVTLGTLPLMPSSSGEGYDFFLSRRGSVASIAREVAHFLTERGYRVLVQDYDIPLGARFVEAMHEAIINSRDLIILFTEDYLRSPYTRKEFTSFEAERVKTTEDRYIIVLRCEDVPLRGLLADCSSRRGSRTGASWLMRPRSTCCRWRKPLPSFRAAPDVDMLVRRRSRRSSVAFR